MEVDAISPSTMVLATPEAGEVAEEVEEVLIMTLGEEATRVLRATAVRHPATAGLLPAGCPPLPGQQDLGWECHQLQVPPALGWADHHLRRPLIMAMGGHMTVTEMETVAIKKLNPTKVANTGMGRDLRLTGMTGSTGTAEIDVLDGSSWTTDESASNASSRLRGHGA